MRFSKRHAAWFILGCAGMALLVAVLFILVQGAGTTQAIRESQQNNHELLTRIVALSHGIDDCTKPGGKCYQRGQKRTGDAVANINRVVILAAACAVGKTGTVAQIETAIQACVIDGLAAQQHHTR